MASTILTADPVVFVVDDDPALRKSLRFLIESVNLKVQTFASAQAFLDNYNTDTPGCLVLDVRMPAMSGLELQQRMRERGINIPIIFITGYGDVPMAVRAMKSGAVDFLEKPVGDQLLLDRIQQAIDRNASSRDSSESHRELERRRELLTRREMEVMQKVVSGLSSREIGTELGVSFKTVEAHRAKIMKKMQATSVPHLVRMELTDEI